jgi:hypothetical protein
MIRQTGAMGLGEDSALLPHITTLADELGRPADRGELESAVVEAFSEVLGLSLAAAPLSTAEAARERELAASFVVGE